MGNGGHRQRWPSCDDKHLPGAGLRVFDRREAMPLASVRVHSANAAPLGGSTGYVSSVFRI